MRISSRGRYALRALVYLARQEKGKVLSVKQIAEVTQISAEFLEQILVRLKRAKLVNSVRGPGGGYSLAADPVKLTVKEIFDAVGETIDLTPCQSCRVSELVCEAEGGCEGLLLWKGATEHLIEFFTSVTLQAVVEGKTILGANA